MVTTTSTSFFLFLPLLLLFYVFHGISCHYCQPCPCSPMPPMPFPSPPQRSCCQSQYRPNPPFPTSPFSGAYSSYGPSQYYPQLQQLQQQQQIPYQYQMTPSSLPSYQVTPAQYARAMPVPVPIPAKEKYATSIESAKQKPEESVKDPFEKDDKMGREEPAKYATASSSSSNPMMAPPIIFPTQTQQMPYIPQQQMPPYFPSYPPPQLPQDRMPIPFPYNPCQMPCVPPRPSFGPPPMPMPQMPLQNCCLRCPMPMPCSSMSKKRAHGLKTLKNDTLEWEQKQKEQQQDVEDGIGKKCNDAKLRKIMEECTSLTMAEAKEELLQRAEKEQSAIEDKRPQAVHVFCAPKGLEYVARTEHFCSGEVADGVCFAFRT